MIITTTPNWDADITDQDVRNRLTDLLSRARQTPPILDDDDLEEAIEEAADDLLRDH